MVKTLYSILHRSLDLTVKSKAKNKYSNVHFEKVERNNNEITIVLTKNVNNHKVKSEYVLDYNSSDESFEIVKYQDI